MHFAEYDSPVGKLLLCSDGTSLKSLTFGAGAAEDAEEDAVIRRTKLWLDAYFRGEDPAADLPLAPEGTPFRKRIWQILRDIPAGEVRTYGEIARSLSATMSAQAVGQAVGANPIAIVIPCHRVVGTGGKLTGYAWGVEKKKWLLDHEAKK